MVEAVVNVTSPPEMLSPASSAEFVPKLTR